MIYFRVVRVVPIVFGTAVAEAVGLNLGLFFCLQLVLMSPKSFLESLVFATAQHSAIRQQGGMVAGILLQLFFVSRLAFSFFMCASSSSCSAHPCRYRQIISKVRLVGWPLDSCGGMLVFMSLAASATFYSILSWFF